MNSGEQVVRSFDVTGLGTCKILLVTGESSKREQKLVGLAMLLCETFQLTFCQGKRNRLHRKPRTRSSFAGRPDGHAQSKRKLSQRLLSEDRRADFNPSTQTFICLLPDRKVAGCVVAESISEAFEVVVSTVKKSAEGENVKMELEGEEAMFHEWVSARINIYYFGIKLTKSPFFFPARNQSQQPAESRGSGFHAHIVDTASQASFWTLFGELTLLSRPCGTQV